MLKARKMANRYRNLFLLCIGLFLICEVLAFAFSSGVLLLLGLAPLVFGLLYTWPRYQTWGTGAEGEEKVAGMLRSLTGCDVFHDIVLPGELTNIDHVVLTPNGIFVIETKNHKGTARCIGDSWELEKVGRMGTHYAGQIGNPSRQVKHNALILRNFILDRLGLKLYVNGIVCFANPECVLDISEPTVDIVRLEELPNSILTYKNSRPISAEEIARIRLELEKYASALE